MLLMVFGYKIVNIDGPLFHLTHERGNDSKFRSIDQMYSTNMELIQLLKSSKDEVLHDINDRKELYERRVLSINVKS